MAYFRIENPNASTQIPRASSCTNSESQGIQLVVQSTDSDKAVPKRKVFFGDSRAKSRFPAIVGEDQTKMQGKQGASTAGRTSPGISGQQGTSPEYPIHPA